MSAVQTRQPEQAGGQSSDPTLSLPAPIVRLLIIFARPLAFLRICIEVLSWKAGRRVESWMVVGAWWGICLGAGHAFKYLLPIALFLPLLPLDRLRLPQVLQNTKRPPPSESTAVQPSTQDTLLHALADLHAIYALLPPSPSVQIQDIYGRFANLGQTRILRGLAVIWTTWVVLGHVVGYRALLALIVTIALLLPSPSFAHFLDLMSKSLLVRRSVALLFLLTFGSPPEQSISFDLSFSITDWVRGKWAASRRPSLALSFRPKVEPGVLEEENTASSENQDQDQAQAGEPIYFRFEVHENQRWWMGLDWTSALLPQERPSWCDSHLLPASPPQSFPLPPSSSIVLPSPTASDPGAQTRRTATWKWLDDDWSIVRAGPGQNSSPLMPAPPVVPAQAGAQASDGNAISPGPIRPASVHSAHSITDDLSISRAQSLAEHAFTKGLERLKARTATPATTVKAASPRSSAEISRGRSESQASDDLQTIAEGLPVPAPAVSMVPTVPAEIICERDEATDADGWVYGDNKWEGVGPKGGLGRFTRRRRWQRRAICSETIQRIPSITDPEPLDAQAASASDASDPASSALAGSSAKARPTISTVSETAVPHHTSTAMASAPCIAPIKARRASSTTSVDRSSLGERDREAGRDGAGAVLIGSPGGGGGGGGARDDVLRQRLKKAMGSVGG